MRKRPKWDTKAFRRRKKQRWRERHPVLEAWFNLRSNAKRRGIPVTWDLESFGAWCRRTGYHILRRDGFQVHRPGDIGPYGNRCRCVPQVYNLCQQFVNRKKEKYLTWREKVLTENLRVGI